MNNKLLISMFLFLILLIGFVFASTPPCKCSEFCLDSSEPFHCYLGNCTGGDLQTMNCTNGGVTAGECPFCPICMPLPECVVENKFNYSGICIDYYNYLITNNSLCFQTVNFSVFKNDSEGIRPLSGGDISLIDTIDDIDYTDVFENEYVNMKHQDSFAVPRCSQNGIFATFIASKPGYDTDAVDLFLKNDDNFILSAKFYLPIGICHTDCTNSYGRCNPECEGFSTNSTDKCEFYDASTYGKNITKLCAYKLKGTDIVLNTTDENYTVIDCCEGEDGIRVIKRPLANVSLIDGENLIVVERPMRIETDTAKIKIYYWE